MKNSCSPPSNEKITAKQGRSCDDSPWNFHYNTSVVALLVSLLAFPDMSDSSTSPPDPAASAAGVPPLVLLTFLAFTRHPTAHTNVNTVTTMQMFRVLLTSLHEHVGSSFLFWTALPATKAITRKMMPTAQQPRALFVKKDELAIFIVLPGGIDFLALRQCGHGAGTLILHGVQVMRTTCAAPC